jgi:hypothetical protein
MERTKADVAVAAMTAAAVRRKAVSMRGRESVRVWVRVAVVMAVGSVFGEPIHT